MALPQRVAALPDYIPRDLKDAAPGHRFQLYLEHWQGQNGTPFAPYKKSRPQGKDERSLFDRECAGVLKDLCPLPQSSLEALKGIRTRQQTLLAHYGTSGYRISTTSTAPFATGLGNEHPIENGFAFLTPYGLPYLAGSGVKGILRRAAEELALENEEQNSDGWTWLAIWEMFGFEGSVNAGSLWDKNSPLGHAFLRDLGATSQHPGMYRLIEKLFATDKKAGARFLDRSIDGASQFLHACLAESSLRGGLQARGVLDFWDVFPKPAGDKLVVEIMTPHFGKYYQGEEAPHDSGAPVPVSFLAVPPKSQFDFHVVCHATRLPPELATTWRSLLDQAFAHAFEWVGFGAKTSVGYGAMAAAGTKTGTGTSAATSSAPAAPSAPLESWPAARLKFNRGNNTLTAEANGKSANAYAPQGEALLKSLPADVQSKIRQNQCFQKFEVQVEGTELRAIAQ